MDRQGWLQLTAVQAGGAICLPVFVIGYALGKSYGIASAALAIVLGNMLLMTLAFVSGVYSSEKRLSTIECAIECFGKKGKGLFSAAMVTSMTGWFAIQLNLMGESLHQIFPIAKGIYGSLGMGIVMTALGTRGLRGVGILANLSMPLLIATIVMGLAGTGVDVSTTAAPRTLTTAGLSLVLACSIGAVVDLPTFFRVAKSRKDAIVSIVVLFGLVIPAVEMVGVILSSANGGGGFIDMLMGAYSSSLWNIWVLGFVLMAGWTTNSANLYSAIVSIGPVVPAASFPFRAVLVGGAGTLLSCLPLMEGLEMILHPIGIVLTSMGAVLICFFITQEKTTAVQNVLAWIAGTATGCLSMATASVTGIPMLDGFVVSLIMMGAFMGYASLKKEILIYENDR